MSERPRVTRVYQNHHLDSTRWEVWEPRDGDTIVTTSYKSGTTWTNHILSGVLGEEDGPSLADRSAIRSLWVDARFMGNPKETLAEQLAEMPSPRELKSHLPLDGLPWSPLARYLIVARDPRDVFMSLLNHYGNYTEFAFSMLNAPDKHGPDLPPMPEPRELWRRWTSEGWFEWESEGWPFWSNLHHTQSYWEFRHLPNFLFLHYADMLADHAGAVRRIAAFVGRELSEERVHRIVEETSFASMKKEAVARSEQESPVPDFWEGGARTFINKGTNGRWRELLTEDDLVLLEQAKARVLSPDCAAWLERGGPVA